MVEVVVVVVADVELVALFVLLFVLLGVFDGVFVVVVPAELEPPPEARAETAIRAIITTTTAIPTFLPLWDCFWLPDVPAGTAVNGAIW